MNVVQKNNPVNLSLVVMLLPVIFIFVPATLAVLHLITVGEVYPLFICAASLFYFQFGLIHEHANRCALWSNDVGSSSGIFNKSDIERKLSTQFLRMSYFLLCWPRFAYLLKSGRFLK